MRDWIKPGTHIACMGTDTKGKQEVDPAILAAATVFADEIAQSITIGEAQHAVGAGQVAEGDITPIGAVINGDHPGRSSDTEITLFDGTGVGLQDLAVASVAAREAEKAGQGIAGRPLTPVPPRLSPGFLGGIAVFECYRARGGMCGDVAPCGDDRRRGS